MAEITRYPDEGLLGRRKIFAYFREITEDNVTKLFQRACAIHNRNSAEISYLYNVYRGRQDVRFKSKVVRPEINEKICINRASEIVTFKTAFMLSSPITYISNSYERDVTDEISRFNSFMQSERCQQVAKSIIDWMHICGVGVKLVLPDSLAGQSYASPFAIYSLDPRDAFTVYSSSIGNRPLLGCIRQYDESGKEYWSCYSEHDYFEIQGDKIIRHEPFALGRIPVVEFPANATRQGAFEIVLPILNAINTLSSCRIDGISDFINSYDVFVNCEIDEAAYKQLSGKRVEIKCAVPGMEPKVYRINSELSQDGVQKAIDDLHEAMLEICGMPNRNGGSSTSDTGQAVIFRDGFSAAESRSKDTENCFIASEEECLKIATDICRVTAGMTLMPYEIKPEFTRKDFANMQSKTQTFIQLLDNDMVHPKLAYQYASPFPDPETAYKMAMEWKAEQERKLQKRLEDAVNGASGDDKNVPDDAEAEPNGSESLE